jgi:molybdopterin-containing oxidoreductase family iron-sulfur binding subunit
MEATLNPGVAPRMRGVVEKCNFCHGRLHAAEAKAAAAGRKDIDSADYVPACVEACPAGAIAFGNLADPQSEIARLAAASDTVRILPKLKTDPKIHYVSRKQWARELAENGFARRKEVSHG